MAKDVTDIIKSDYDDEMAFMLIEFMYNDKPVLLPMKLY